MKTTRLRAGPAGGTAAARGARVYLVDDHAMFREGLRAVLVAAGHEVAGESGEAGCALAEVGALRPDVVLLDLSLQDSSGLSFLVELAARPRAPRVVVLTMSAHPRHVSEALRLGAAGYVLKGSPVRELLAAIDVVLRGGRHLGQGVEHMVDVAAALKALSPRERQIIDLVAHGHTSAAIGLRLHLSPKTVETYRSRLMAKLGVRDMAALIRLVIDDGLIAPGIDGQIQRA